MISALSCYLPKERPVLILAPMQDVTDLPFMKIMHHYKGADLYYTEYFRVHRDSTLEKHISRSITENPTGKPVIAQMIGEDIPALVRTAKQLERLPIAGVDLNLGCPAPVVCKKSAGGGLLRHLEHLNNLLRTLRENISGPFTVKTRVGFESQEEFEQLLEIFSRYLIDALTVHGRTVKEMYRSHVHYDRIAKAVSHMPCPVFANGNIISPNTAKMVTKMTQARGLMIGRGAIRNPWLFEQIRETFEMGYVKTRPMLRDVLEYIRLIYQETHQEGFKETAHVSKMKKYMNFIAQGVNGNDIFLNEIRRATSEADFFSICTKHLDNDAPFEVEPPTSHLINSGNPRVDCYTK